MCAGSRGRQSPPAGSGRPLQSAPPAAGVRQLERRGTRGVTVVLASPAFADEVQALPLGHLQAYRLTAYLTLFWPCAVVAPPPVPRLLLLLIRVLPRQPALDD